MRGTPTAIFGKSRALPCAHAPDLTEPVLLARLTIMRPQSYSPLPGSTEFVPALEGMRAVAALGVLTTHVAFLTASSTGSTVHRIWGRFDLWVAVFFALSGFLLWRTHARRARATATNTTPLARPPLARPPLARPSVTHYVRSRAVRILPAYLAMALTTLLLLPDNATAGLRAWLANLTLTQVFVPDGLVAGLTHAWSLSVEAAFYAILPAIWLALARLRGRYAGWRIPVILTTAAASLAWAWVPWPASGPLSGINSHTLPWAFASWFAAGMVLAELAVTNPQWLAPLTARPWRRAAWWVLAALLFMTTTSTALYTEGFVRATPAEFAGRTASGAVLAFLLLGPLVLAPAGARFPLLASPPMLALGRWSYGIFLWHMVIVQLVFGVLEVPMFGGSMALVWVATAALSIVVAATSYAWIEEPARRAWAGHTYEQTTPTPAHTPAHTPTPTRTRNTKQ